MHTHAHVYDIIGNSQVFPQSGRPFAWNYHVYHACGCMCVGAPPTTPTPIHPPPNHPPPHPPNPPTTPHPQSCREPKTPKFNKSWTNRDNSILFEDSLPLNIPELIKTIADHPRHPPHPPAPPPRAEETQIGRITITLEWIEIIQFCLKICDPLTLLHTYRLGLMCRWGVSYHKWHFYVFDPKKCSCDPPFLFLHWIPLDHI